MPPIIRILREFSFACSAFSVYLDRRRTNFHFGLLSVSLQYFCRLGIGRFVPENKYNLRQIILVFKLCVDCIVFYLATFIMGIDTGIELNLLFHQLELIAYDTYQLYQEVRAVHAQLNLAFQQLQQQEQNVAPASAG